MLHVVFDRFYREIKKHNDDVIMTSFHVFWDLKISNFVKSTIGYHSCKFEISWMS